MQNSNAENNKRIAKNTLFLYFRSILTLGVGLYTSREVLAQLGISDFGVYINNYILNMKDLSLLDRVINALLDNLDDFNLTAM